LFFECNQQFADKAAIEKQIEDMAKDSGPFVVTFARYARKGDPKTQSLTIPAMRTRNNKTVEELCAIGVPSQFARLITGISIHAIYNRNRRTSERKYRAKVKARIGAAAAPIAEGTTCQPAPEMVEGGA